MMANQFEILIAVLVMIQMTQAHCKNCFELTDRLVESM